MTHPITYCDLVAGRRDHVRAVLASAQLSVQPVDDPAEVPANALQVLLGVEDLASAMPTIRRLGDQRPDRQLVLLWTGQDGPLMMEAVRLGARDVVASPEAAASAFARAARAASAPARNGRVVVVYSLKGGIGKSTLSGNLAIAMHRLSQRPTTALDLSLPCGNLEMYLDVRPQRSIGDLLAAGSDIEPAMVHQALASHASGVKVLAGPRAATVEALTRHSCRPVLEALGEQGGLTVVDLGAFIEFAHASVLEAADLVIVPVTPLISSLGTLNQAREVLEGFGLGHHQILPVMNHAGPDTAQLSPDGVARLMGGKPAHVLPWGGPEVAASLNEGLPVCQHRPNSPLAVAIEGVAQDCLERLGLASPQASPLPALSDGLPFAWLRDLFFPKGAAHVHP